ncbi:MAG: P1 family peptidase [Actinomycetota bacterium]|nr:P1 family peptidase [Actinomycetota bacterium]MDA8312529.1 P1 family peptidase [Actinomycetota bacterium]
MPVPVHAGTHNDLRDVAGVRVGHAQRTDHGWLSGVTVVLPPPAGATCGVDVRGGAPGTRETDLLDPRNTVERVHGIVLTGGSAYGLAAVDGVVRALGDARIGFPVGDAPHEVVPIVPAAVIFDLGRGGDFAKHPTPEVGREAYQAAVATTPLAPLQGCVGAGTGACAGRLKGGVGSASSVLDDGSTVAALMVVNSHGTTVDPATGALLGAPFGLAGEFAALRPAAATGDAGGPAPRTLNTTIGVVATDVGLTKAQCAKLAGVAHDGLARAIHPAHSPYDGDTVFAMATGSRTGDVDLASFYALLEVAADCVTRSIVHAMLHADSVETEAGRWPAYRDVHLDTEGP